MRSKTIVQLVLFITSIVIIFTFIKPTYAKLQLIQAQSDEYDTALQSADNFNTELRKQISAADRITTSQKEALDRFLPEDIDTISVMRDIESIARRNSMQVVGLSSGEVADENGQDTSETYYDEDEYYDEDGIEFAQGQTSVKSLPTGSVSFTLGVQGSYENFKLLLQDIERNAYPFEITSLKVSPSGSTNTSNGSGTGGTYSYDITMKTYQLSASTE